MAFSPMDGFFLAVFLAVCILVAVVLRCLCYRCCLHSCSDKFRHPNEDGILPRHSTPTITPQQRIQHQQRSPQMTNQSRGPSHIPPSGTVFTIYTFPQHPSPDFHRPPQSSRPPKYSTVPADSPPKYEDLFPITSKATTPISSPSIAMEMQMTAQSFSELQPLSRDSDFVQAHTSTSVCSSGQAFIPAVPITTNNSEDSVPSSLPTQVPTRVPKEDPPLYDTIYPEKSGE